jgi:succinate-semialdehyde dehydrogenase/glutarate-semialdehyde dehydrogenase
MDTVESSVASLVSEARCIQPVWAARSPEERAEVLLRLRRIVADRADSIAWVVQSDTGKIKAEALFEVGIACDYLRYLAHTAPRFLRPRKAKTGWVSHRRASVRYEPYGVVAAITPWNFPFAISMSSVNTAIATGNAVVLKPSEHAPATGRLVGELLAEATGLPDLVGVATGDGRVGAALVEAGIDKIAFTGSTATGKRIMAAAAESLTPLVLELGGKDAMIVCGDADVARAARGAVWGAMYGCGQVCMSIERAYVAAEVYEEFVQAVVAEASRLKFGDEPNAHMGPLIGAFQREKVERQLEEALSSGARVLLGGRAIDGSGHGFEPTVVVDVDHDMAIMREETFGPVLPIMPVQDDEQAIRLANQSEYGLDASVWSRDSERARRIAGRLDVGTVVINDHLINYLMADLPFGGTGGSGFGRMHGEEGLRELSRPKAIVEDRIVLGREPYWFDTTGSGEETASSLLDFRHGSALRQKMAGGWRLLRDALR